MKRIIICSLIMATSATYSINVSAKESHSKHQHNSVDSVYKNRQTLTLEQVTDIALKYSPELKSVSNDIEIAKANKLQAGAYNNPEIFFEAENILGSGVYNEFDSAEYNAGISQEFELGRKRDARKQIALSQIDQAELKIDIIKQKIKREIHLAYAQILSEEEELELSYKQVSLAKDMLKSVSKRVKQAAESEIQQSKAEIMLSNAELKLKQNKNRLKYSKAKLARLMGIEKIDFSLDHSHFFEANKPKEVEHYTAKIGNISDIKQFEYIKAELAANLKYNEYESLPNPNVNIGYRNFSDSDDHAFIVGVSLPIPVFNKNEGGIAKARAELSKADSSLSLLKLELEQQVLEQWQMLNSSYLEVEELKKSLIPSAEKAFNQASSNYERGKFSYLEVLDTQRTLSEVKEQYYQSLKNYHIAQANIERLTSGE